MQLSVIIVNYNVKFFLEQCLSSVIKACRNIQAEIIVVDNHSEDGSESYFQNRFLPVRFIWKQSNDGFGKANNEAVKLARGNCILFLNPDTIVSEDCFEKCLQQFATMSTIGALGVRMIDGSGCYLPESKRGFPGLFTALCKMSGLTAAFPNSALLANYYLGHLPENKSAEVAVLSGAFMMVRQKVLQQVGCFDEAFFMYAEDIDLSYRIQQAGYQNYYFAGTTILHFKGESTRKQDRHYIKTFYGAMLLFVKKHYPKWRSTFYAVFIKVAVTVKLMFSAIEKRNAVTQPAGSLPDGNATLVANAGVQPQLAMMLQKNFLQLHLTETLYDLPAMGHSLLLSETILSYKDIINFMQEYAGAYKFYVHGSATKSMVGSSDKNTVGAVIQW